MRIVSDIHGLERVEPPGVTVVTVPEQVVPNRWERNIRLLRAAWGADWLVIHFSLYEVLFFTILLFLIPFQHCRLATLDFFVVRPKAWIRPLVRWALGRVSLLLVYFRETSRFEQLYGVAAEKFRYIPFKINSWERVQKAAIRDEGYIFVGGRSRRDFRTLFEALKTLPYPVKILTAREADINPHGSSMAGLTAPPNVELFYNDTDSQYFVELMSGARLVVLPIVKESGIQAGIGVYLLGMALHKCVIISEALGVSDVLLDQQACIVPPGDPEALRKAIETLWNDSELRAKYADAGYRYALPLGGEDELRRSVLGALGGI